jgi:hypothetical protein
MRNAETATQGCGFASCHRSNRRYATIVSWCYGSSTHTNFAYSTPQRWLYVGLIISGVTLAGCLSYLGYDFVRSRRKKVKNEKQINKGR